MVRLIELFGGIGACSKALERLGIEYQLVDYVEIDKFAVKSFNAIHGTNFEPQDVTTWDKNVEVDMIMHGSPCQDFSIAGNNAGGDKGSGTRSSLMYETVRIVEKLKPRIVVWENVKNLLSKKHRHNFEHYLEHMSNLGYQNYYQVLNAKDYGVPQNRERVFTISIKGAHKPFVFPEKIPLDIRLKDILEPKVDEKYYLSTAMLNYFTSNHEKQENKGNGFKFSPTFGDGVTKSVTTKEGCRMTDNFVKCVQVGQIYGTEREPNPQAGRIYDSQGLSPTVDSCSGGNRMPKIIVREPNKKGYDEATIGDTINIEQPNSKTRRGRVGHGVAQTIMTACHQVVVEAERTPLKFLGRNGKKTDGDYAFCVDTSNTGGVKETYSDGSLRIRKLTPKECWRLMAFDDSDFEKAEKVNSNSQLYRQAGNSIVVDVLCAIFENMREVIEMQIVKEEKIVTIETDHMIDIMALIEKEPDLFEELARDYPAETNTTYQYKVS